MKKSNTMESCPLCGSVQKPAAKKSLPVISEQARVRQIDTKVIGPVEGESGDDQTADKFAELIAGLNRTL